MIDASKACPCDNCICVPMCIGKKWSQLVSGCILLAIYLTKHEMSVEPGEAAAVPILALKQEYHIQKSSTGMLTWSCRLFGELLEIYTLK